MTILYVLVPAALVLVIGAVAAYVWAVRSGQFDDLSTPAIRVLRDDSERGAARKVEPIDDAKTPPAVPNASPAAR